MSTILQKTFVAFVFLTVSLSVIQCHPADSRTQKENKNSHIEKKEDAGAVPQQKPAWKPKMDQPSELAQIMRNLHAEGKQRKSKLSQGDVYTKESQNLLRMLTATPTEAHMVGPAFEPMAKAFIAQYEEIARAATVEAQIEAHNAMVQSCVACHSQFCQGPIPRIEQLYIQTQ